MVLEKLHRVGICLTCKEEFELPPPSFAHGSNALPNHKQAGNKCSGSGMTAWDLRPIIKNEQDAIAVAEFLSADDGHCLVLASHSMACGDGRDCTRTRMNLARTLSDYFLDEFGPPKAKAA